MIKGIIIAERTRALLSIAVKLREASQAAQAIKSSSMERCGVSGRMAVTAKFVKSKEVRAAEISDKGCKSGARHSCSRAAARRQRGV